MKSRNNVKLRSERGEPSLKHLFNLFGFIFIACEIKSFSIYQISE